MTATTWAPVESTLARYGALTRDAMAGFLPHAEPARHLYDLVRDYPARGGKALRPALVLATCQAVGGTLRAGLGPAVAIEMLHNAFLVHDDVEDGSSARRGRPTLHAGHGTALAINAGDALAGLALAPLRNDPVLGPRVCAALADEVRRAVRQTTEGQAMELGWCRDHVVDLDAADYLRMVAKKTCWYTTVAPLRLGALAGSRGTGRFPALTRFGLRLGAAFQIRDDLLDLEGDATTGKDLGSDLREGKRTLMMIDLLARACEADRAWLVAWLARPHRDQDGIERVRELMARHGCADHARHRADALARSAAAALDEAVAGLPPSDHLDFLRDLVPYMTQRRH